MAYITVQYLINTLGEQRVKDLAGDVVDPTPPATEHTSVVGTSAIARADALIDAYVGNVYAVPLTVVPEVIKSISVDLAIYYLYGRSPKYQLTDDLKQLFKSALELLEKISRGELSLGTLTPAPSVAYTEPYDENKFTMDCLEPRSCGT